MGKDLLNKKINPNNVKELLKQYQCDELNKQNNQPKKIRIYDDPGEYERYKNILARERTNQIYNKAYFDKFWNSGKTVVPEIVPTAIEPVIAA